MSGCGCGWMSKARGMSLVRCGCGRMLLPLLPHAYSRDQRLAGGYPAPDPSPRLSPRRFALPPKMPDPRIRGRPPERYSARRARGEREGGRARFSCFSLISHGIISHCLLSSQFGRQPRRDKRRRAGLARQGGLHRLCFKSPFGSEAELLV